MMPSGARRRVLSKEEEGAAAAERKREEEETEWEDNHTWGRTIEEGEREKEGLRRRWSLGHKAW